jgi:sugar phosphate isomerase/epimerase
MFRYCLNTSTIQPASLLDKIRAAARAGYAGIELWITDIEGYLEQGGKLAAIRKALDDAALARPSMIYLKGWADEDSTARAAALDLCRRRLDMARELGVERFVAGPPPGKIDEAFVTDCYRRLLETSVAHGVPASIEYLGFVQGVSTLDVAWRICQGSGQSAATLTADSWHNFRGGSDESLLDSIPPERISIFHWNDAPAQPPRQTQTDNDRVLPGEGILNLSGLAARLRKIGYNRFLSLEIFHRGYWEQDPLHVAALGLQKMKASVE